MDPLLGGYFLLGSIKVRRDNDLVDRLHHRYTALMLSAFAFIVAYTQYHGHPIICWCPAQFVDNHEDFTNKICWVQNTYYVPISQKRIPEAGEQQAQVSYYQWVPFILLMQALLFHLPCWIWRFLNNKAGVHLDKLVDACDALQHGAYKEYHLKTLKFIAHQVDRYVHSTRDYKVGCLHNCRHFLSRNCCLVCGKKYGNQMVFLYLTCKLMYLVNVVGQLFVLNAFLGTNNLAYGYEIVRKMIIKEDWSAIDVFPRVTLCDFDVRTLGNIHRHTVQCVLPINLFNEKIYIFLWFWYLFVAVVTLSNFAIWMVRCLVRRDGYRFVKHHLCTVLKYDLYKAEKVVCRQFTEKYLRQDGILLLRLLAINGNSLSVAEAIKYLWDNYRAKNTLEGRVPDVTLSRAGDKGWEQV